MYAEQNKTDGDQLNNKFNLCFAEGIHYFFEDLLTRRITYAIDKKIPIRTNPNVNKLLLSFEKN